MDEKQIRRKLISEQILEALTASGMSRKEFAQKMRRLPSEVTKWLSGKHNFTSDLLAEISVVLQKPITGVDRLESYGPYSSIDEIEPYEEGKLYDSVICRVGIDLPLETLSRLRRLADSQGMALSQFMVTELENLSKESPVSAYTFAGIWNDSYPSVDEIVSARTSNRLPEA